VKNGESRTLLTFASKIQGTGLSEYSIKSLQDIYTAFPEYSSENTLILDDSPHKSVENRANALYLPAYTVSDDTFVPEFDTALLSVLKYFESVGDSTSLTTSLQNSPFGYLKEDQRKIRHNVMDINKNEATFSINEEWIVSSVDEISRWTNGRPAFRPLVPPSSEIVGLDPTVISKTQQKRLAKLEKREAADRQRQATRSLLHIRLISGDSSIRKEDGRSEGGRRDGSEPKGKDQKKRRESDGRDEAKDNDTDEFDRRSRR
jgi:hypothetical protein